MAKRQKVSDPEGALFPEVGAPGASAMLGRRGGHRTLFLPKYLGEESRKPMFSGRAYESAHVIVCRWAELETTGHLPQFKERSVDAAFLNEVFGEALGYATKTAQPEDYQLEHQYHVDEVGPADGALGVFPSGKSPLAIIELKGASTDLDRDKSNGRTAVRQCWDYLTGLPDCPWAIVSNFSIIRLYHRNRTPFAYEEFTLQELRKPERFREFYYLFERGGLVHRGLAKETRATLLLEKTAAREKSVGDDLYRAYQRQRNELIAHLCHKLDKSFDAAVRIAQKLLDRVIFIAFCEDRGLLPEKSLEKAWKYEPPYRRATKQKWENLRGLFHEVDKGGSGVKLEVGFNGGLFKHDPEVDELYLDDEPWVAGLKGFGDWDFRDEVNVDVLGHLFERSITELEKLRVGGLFALTQAGADAGTEDNPKAAKNGKGEVGRADATDSDPNGNGRNGNGGNGHGSAMPKSAQRKRFGIYYTPPAFTSLIVERTVDVLARERFEALAKTHKSDPDTGKDAAGKPVPEYWKACIAALRDLKIVDPACGSGAFLIRAYESLEHHYQWAAQGLIAARGVSAADLNGFAEHIPEWILSDNLYGVDVSAEAVEITHLALWIQSARPNRTLSDLSKNIVCGNSLVADATVHEKAIDWRSVFGDVFARGGDRAGFDAVIGNPPWERVKLQEREFFSFTDPATAEAVSAADRRKRIAAMSKAKPELHAAYEQALGRAQRMLDYARESAEYPLTGKGDVNLYMLFVELARKLVAPDGLVGVLVPSGIATDDTTKEFFAELMERKSLVSLYDFENKEPVFEDVHRSFKFTVLVFGGLARKRNQADFVFFARTVEEVAAANKRRHIALTAADMALLNPNTKTCPIFRTRRDADLTRGIYKRVPILIDENRKKGGNPWGIEFLRMFDQTNDAEHFTPPETLKADGFKRHGNRWRKGKKSYLPLYEAKMVQAFDHRAASVLIEKGNWVRQGQKAETSPVQHANPEFGVMPRWWVADSAVAEVGEGRAEGWFLAYKDITSSTNERTMIAAFLPRVAVVNSAPVMFVGKNVECRREACLLANLNSFVYDYVARQKVSALHLNFFIVEQLPTLPPDTYTDKCPWSKRETLEHWISERVLKLTCTADDMKPLAQAAGFKGSQGDGVHIWKETERTKLRAELDAAYFHLYGVEREDAEYMLSTFTNTGRRKEADLSGDESPWLPGGTGDLILRAYDDLLLP